MTIPDEPMSIDGSRAYAAGVNAAVDRLFTDWVDGPGGAVTVVHEGTTVHHRAYGLADVDEAIPFGTDQLFPMASVTKQFVAHLVLLLEQRGALRRDDPVHAHLPELGDLGGIVTLDHLLHHRSGVRDHITLATLAGGRLLEGLSREAIRTLLLAQRSLDFPPGTAAVYSNSNYLLLSWVVERVTGQPLADALADHVFRPAGMTSTVLVENPAAGPSTPVAGYEGTATTGYRPWHLHIGHVAGDGGVWSTLDDLARWLRYHDRAPGESRTAFDAMMCAEPLVGGGTTDYLAGLREGRLVDERWTGHSGGWAGFRSQTLWFPALRLGVAVIANQTIDPTAAALEVADRFLPAPDPGLAGTYRNEEIDTSWVVDVEGSSVTLSPSGSFGRGDRLPLRRTGPASFVLTRAALARWDLEFDTELTFESTPAGGTRSIHVRSGIVRSLRLTRAS